ncbi:protein transporter tim10 [Coemansia sp. RSA 2523]|nr:protein transporter tim10 [Coemansia sp. RSA 1591]KAJ1754237.1 protein transporter tim10 [Coemansia sp. RSA 1752]KAJ1764660.1 protein transporter tim10 [Coemansia sp. RSA 1824]KAJ1781658.1 protein transporter tim10 [Coemansia sp. RSA 1938]KAJ1791255.1 protein transporter tim10 [Coemansia sp. RSA 2167]KAJ1802712.1 protein transporter tim10 [Coemansia sp. RSA 2523]KAJ2132343.1 protein transporter tim10 [Coemansia sp. RSA 921]KAJ2135152.1 protein transporter tim10 [Coemansia sp. RSA 788]KAJ
MFGGAFGGGSQQPAQPAMGGQAQMDPNAQMMAAEQEMEMVTTMFEHLNDLCYKKCLIQRYSDEELTKAESVCIDRCAAKYFQVNREVSDKLAKMTQANSL